MANTGWLATDVTAHARKTQLVLPPYAELTGDLTVVGGPARRRFDHLEGRAALRLRGGHDGTPDRALLAWTVAGAAGTRARVRVHSERGDTSSSRSISPPRARSAKW